MVSAEKKRLSQIKFEGRRVLQEMERKMDTEFREELQRTLSALPGRIGCYYKNMVTGETFGYHEDEPMMAASVIKLFVMTEAFAQIEEGTLSADRLITMKRRDCVPSCGALTYLHDGIQVTVMDLITLMIILSDNTATNVLIDLLGADAVNRRIRVLGFEKTILQRKMYETEKSARGIQNYITAGETGRLLEQMYRGTLISRKASAQMIAILKNQQLNHKIPYYIEPMEAAPEIAHKTGEDDGITHDAGIVFAKEPFVLCFCGNETIVTEYERVMGKTARALLDQVTGC